MVYMIIYYNVCIYSAEVATDASGHRYTFTNSVHVNKDCFHTENITEKKKVYFVIRMHILLYQ